MRRLTSAECIPHGSIAWHANGSIRVRAIKGRPSPTALSLSLYSRKRTSRRSSGCQQRAKTWLRHRGTRHARDINEVRFNSDGGPGQQEDTAERD